MRECEAGRDTVKGDPIKKKALAATTAMSIMTPKIFPEQLMSSRTWSTGTKVKLPAHNGPTRGCSLLGHNGTSRLQRVDWEVAAFQYFEAVSL